MFITENLFSLFFFAIPACVFVLYERNFKLYVAKESDIISRTSAVLVFSLFMFAVNIWVCNDFLGLDILNTLKDIDSLNQNIFILCLAVGANILFSFFSSFIWSFLWQYPILWIMNIINKLTGNAQRTATNDVLVEIFRNKCLKGIDTKKDCIVKIKCANGTEHVGLLYITPDSWVGDTAFVLSKSTSIESYFEYDKRTPNAPPFFNEVLYEYINIEKGYSISFYNTQKYLDYLKTYSPE